MERILLVTVGPPGLGKTTLARELEARGWRVSDLDEVGDRKESRAAAWRREIEGMMQSAGTPVVAVAPNMARAHRAALAALAETLGWTVRYVAPAELDGQADEWVRLAVAAMMGAAGRSAHWKQQAREVKSSARMMETYEEQPMTEKEREATVWVDYLGAHRVARRAMLMMHELHARITYASRKGRGRALGILGDVEECDAIRDLTASAAELGVQVRRRPVAELADALEAELRRNIERVRIGVRRMTSREGQSAALTAAMAAEFAAVLERRGMTPEMLEGTEGEEVWREKNLAKVATFDGMKCTMWAAGRGVSESILDQTDVENWLEALMESPQESGKGV